MEQCGLFSILDSVDSTNNYAMGKVHEGLAKHGMAWFAHEQTAGKGQRGKTWESRRGNNILLSILIQHPPALTYLPFEFNAFISITCCEFISGLINSECRIKWPNDIYLGDRKAAGILIENVIRGKSWNWSVVGIGININQEVFHKDSGKAVSLKQVTGNELDVIELARKLHKILIGFIEPPADIMNMYNRLLYKKNEEVILRKDNTDFKTIIRSVDKSGQLHTSDVMDRKFTFGEVQWVLS